MEDKKSEYEKAIQDKEIAIKKIDSLKAKVKKLNSQIRIKDKAIDQWRGQCDQTKLNYYNDMNRMSRANMEQHNKITELSRELQKRQEKIDSLNRLISETDNFKNGFILKSLEVIELRKELDDLKNKQSK